MERGNVFLLEPNVEYDSPHRFFTVRQMVYFTLVLPRTDSAFQRCMLYWGKEAKKTGKNQENKSLLDTQWDKQPDYNSLLLYQEEFGEKPIFKRNGGLSASTLPPNVEFLCFSPVRLQNVNDPDIKQQPFPFTIPGRDATHTEKDKRERKQTFG